MTDEKKKQAGKARWIDVTKSERKVLVSKAAHARWKGQTDKVHIAAHEGIVDLGGAKLPCAVLEDGTRVLSERGVSDALGYKRHPDDYARKNEAAATGQEVLPGFISRVANYLSPAARKKLANPIRHQKTKGWGIPSISVDAMILADICEAFLAAREDGVLEGEDLQVARAADKLMRALARVAIAALIDEATGYQVVRDRDELQKLLAVYVSEEHRPWMAKFPNEFYSELFRLRGIKTDDIRKRPSYFGHLTNDVVYKRLLPGMLPRLDEVNPVTETGRRARKNHQHLLDEGEAHLRNHLAGVVYLMRSSTNWNEFKRVLDKASPIQTFHDDEGAEEPDDG